MSLNDPHVVRAEYATENGLAGRASVYRWTDGADPHGRRLPPFDGPLRVTRAPYVFVAEK